MSTALLELAADALGDLVPDVVFLGGATIELWITDPGAPPPRPTKDVDVVVECATTTDFHEFESKLRERGFVEDQESGVICRWKYIVSGLLLDAMPERGAVLGFENRWQGASIPHALTRDFNIISLVDGREELIGEVQAAEPELQAFVAARVAQLLEMTRIEDGLAGAVRGDPASQDRVDAVIRPRLALLAEPRDLFGNR